jgi:hypothetical protein
MLTASMTQAATGTAVLQSGTLSKKVRFIASPSRVSALPGLTKVQVLAERPQQHTWAAVGTAVEGSVRGLGTASRVECPSLVFVLSAVRHSDLFKVFFPI